MSEIFDHEAFSLLSLTTGFNSAPHIDPAVLNMFDVEPVDNRTVMIVKSDKQLQVLMPGEIGEHPNIDQHDAENAKPVNLFRYPFDSHIVPSDLDRVNSLKDKKLKAVELATLVKSHMTKHKSNHRYTAVYSAYTALKGRVKNRDGVVLCDLFNVLDVPQRTVDLKLGKDNDSAVDIPKILKGIGKETKKIAKEHGHMVISGVECRIGQEMIERILSHKSIKEFYGEEIHAKRQVAFADDPSQINICGIKFTTDEADEVAEKGACYPTGVRNLFAMLRAPSDTLTGGTNKRECYITTEKKAHDEGLGIRSRSIYLPICRDPALLCEIFSSD